jgi:SpoVK/Ycf46/Vps4 family AAA+-type ATPase
MFTGVATTFQQVMTELNGAESKEDVIVIITKDVLKLTKQNGR